MPTFQFQGLDVYKLAKQIAVRVQGAHIQDKELRDQATRAAKSCFLNLSEGLPSDFTGVRRRHFAIAKGSLCEMSAAIDLALAFGAINETLATEVLADAKRVAAMIRTL